MNTKPKTFTGEFFIEKVLNPWFVFLRAFPLSSLLLMITLSRLRDLTVGLLVLHVSPVYSLHTGMCIVEFASSNQNLTFKTLF